MNENFDLAPFRKIWQSDTLNSDPKELQEVLRYTKLVGEVLNVQNSAMAVLDMSTMMYLCVLGDMEKIIGWKNDVLMQKGAAFYISLMPKEDYQGLEVMNKLFLDYVAVMEDKKTDQFRCLYDYKLMQPDGSTKRILQESIALKRDDVGNVLFTLGILSNITNQKRDGRQHLSFTDGKRNSLYEVTNSTGTYRALPAISKREKEILQLLGRDFSNKEIAEKLFISEHTVLTHRRNLLRKFDMSDTLELINFLTLYRMLN